MNTDQLIRELNILGVNRNNYSINEGLKIDAYILSEADGLWKLSYYDEKGNQTDISWYKTSEEAHLGLLEQFKNETKI